MMIAHSLSKMKQHEELMFASTISQLTAPLFLKLYSLGKKKIFV